MGHDSVVSRYAIPTGIPQVNDWSTGPSGFRASQHVYFFFDSLVCCVLYELDLVSCFLFGGHLKILNFKFVNHHLGYLGIYLI